MYVAGYESNIHFFVETIRLVVNTVQCALLSSLAIDADSSLAVMGGQEFNGDWRRRWFVRYSILQTPYLVGGFTVGLLGAEIEPFRC